MTRWSKGTLDHDGDGRAGGSRKETDMSKEREAAEQQAYDNGRRARKSAIARNQPPHGKGDKLLSHWQAGWDYEDGLRGAAGEQDNAVANDPNRDQSGKAAVGQAKTASAPKGGKAKK